ncbi:MAG: hypothetical protein II650_08600 [Clostridia bacterium]|nr:hypothetical protein [Clostridia bacterium]
MNAKKICCLLLALLLLLPLFASCSEKPGDDQQKPSDNMSPEVSSSGEPAEQEPQKDMLDAREDVSDEVPDADFGGRTFRIAGDEEFEDYYLTDEQNGEVVNDAVYLRNAAVEERFNVTLDANVFEESSITDRVKNSVTAGDDEYQMISGHIIYLGMAVTNKIMYDMADLPHIDFNKPWWSSSTIEDLTYKGMTFIAIGDFALSSITKTYCMFYNKVLATDFGLPDLYEVVREGEWTLDKQIELSTGVYTDKNGDGKRDKEDTYALSTSTKSAANAYLWAFGKKIATQQEDGTYEISYFDEKIVSLMERLYNLYYETDQVYFEIAHNTMIAFEPGNAIFADGVFDVATSTLRDVEFEYGIIPYPKWDSAQASYYTSVDGGHEGLAVPRSITDPEFIGTMFEVLCAESWKKTVPAYYDTALKYKGARDYDSIAMIDMIMESRIFDFGYVYGGWGPVFWIQYLLETPSKDIASYYQKNHKVFDKYMEKVYKAFDEYEGG